MASSQAALFLKCILTADIKYKQTDYLNIMRYNEQIALKKSSVKNNSKHAPKPLVKQSIRNSYFYAYLILLLVADEKLFYVWSLNHTSEAQPIECLTQGFSVICIWVLNLRIYGGF